MNAESPQHAVTSEIPTHIAFADARLIAIGSPRTVADQVKRALDAGESGQVLVFDAATSAPVELDLRGTLEDVLGRMPIEADAAVAEPVRRPGRPKLGVVAREVTLLPRHWEWLAAQPGGASVTLRKLVEKARLASADEDRIRIARDVTYRFVVAMAGNESGFEEAARALYAGDRTSFQHHTESWPTDVRAHARQLAQPAFESEMGRD